MLDARVPFAVQLNDYYEFPFELDMFPYTTEGVESTASLAASATGAGGEADAATRQPDRPQIRYELRGVVIHSGTAQGGHYYSLIRDRGVVEPAWYTFDDKRVTPFDVTDIAETAYGGSVAATAANAE